jgi:ketosteroid isomerase-like protein
MNFHNEKDDQLIVLKYFRLIDEKDMPSLLNLFTEDCTIYEPFSRDFPSNEGKGKKPLKGTNEIESFFHVVMMASDGLKHEIEFVYSPIEHTRQNGDSVTTRSSSVVSALATFYRYEGGDKLKQKLVFNIVSEQIHDTLNKITRYGNDKDIKIDTRKIERLYVCDFSC